MSDEYRPKTRIHRTDYHILTDAFGKLSKSHVWVDKENFCGDVSRNYVPFDVYDSVNEEVIKIYPDPIPEYEETKTEDDIIDGKIDIVSDQPDEKPYLIVGFDCEFKTPEKPLRGNLPSKRGKVKITDEQREQSTVEVLSYQFYASNHLGEEWEGICLPHTPRIKDGDNIVQEGRITFAEFLTFVFAVGIRTGKTKLIPKHIYLCGHFTRADLPLFKDFRETIFPHLNNIRNTFVTVEERIRLSLRCGDFSNLTSEQKKDTHKGKEVLLKITIRDTQLMTPATSKSLKALGDLLELPKKELTELNTGIVNPIQNMDKIRELHWELFKEYAITDAKICNKYLQKIRSRNIEVTGNTEIPQTLTQIGANLLLRKWKDMDKDILQILGRQKVTERIWEKGKNDGDGGYITKNEKPFMDNLSWWEQFAVECYHGGRNEQYWFGPAYEADWTDYDLSSAYPTAMGVLGEPLWEKLKYTLNHKDYTYGSLSIANITFKFPDTTRFPTLPVRSDHGVIFPLEGKTYVTGTEIQLALSLGCEIKINHGCLVPTNLEFKPFLDFTKDCVKNRKSCLKDGKETLDSQFWKELTNSTYGKTSQGLRKKNVYDLRQGTTKKMSPSRLTNPFYASFITGFVRATLGEILNEFDSNVCVFSVTTDGFITDASDDQVLKAQQKPIAQMFAKSNAEINNVPQVIPLSVKHRLRRPLGVRTRFQVTLQPGTPKSEKDESHIVCATSGFSYRNERYMTLSERNDNAFRRFFNRKPNEKTESKSMITVSEMRDHSTDLVEKWSVKRLNLEFDWKRLPHVVREVKWNGFKHVCWSTVPLRSKQDFDTLRNIFESFDNAENKKSREDLYREKYSEWELRRDEANMANVDFTENPPDKKQVYDSTEKIIFNLKDYTSFYRYAEKVDVELQLGSMGKEKKYLRQHEPDLNLLRMMLCRALKQRKAGLKMDENVDTSANEWASYFTSHGLITTRSNIENGKYNQLKKNQFIKNIVPRTPRVMRILNAIKEEYTALDIDLIVTPSTGLYFLRHLSPGVTCPLMDKFKPEEIVPLPDSIDRNYSGKPSISKGSLEHLAMTLSAAIFRSEWGCKFTSIGTFELATFWSKNGWNRTQEEIQPLMNKLLFSPKLCRITGTDLPELPKNIWIKTPQLKELVNNFKNRCASGLIEENIWIP